jgi:hypothetical protein
MYKDLNPQKALIFRITHRDNVAWMLDHGLHCPRSPTYDPNYVQIGNPDLIDKRFNHPVRHAMGGTLGDYLPFYFTPFSMMLLNIKTGYNGIRKRDNDEIVILASSLLRLRTLNIPFLFTNIHAYMKPADFYTDLADLSHIDWNILQKRDFARDLNDLGKTDRYMAEALVRDSLPVDGLLGLVCYNKEVESQLNALTAARNLAVKTIVRPDWYFR